MQPSELLSAIQNLEEKICEQSTAVGNPQFKFYTAQKHNLITKRLLLMLTSAGINKTTATGGLYPQQKSYSEQHSTRASWPDRSCSMARSLVGCAQPKVPCPAAAHGLLWLYPALLFKVQGYAVAQSPQANHGSLLYLRYKQSMCKGDGGKALLFLFRTFHSPPKMPS